MPAGHPDQLHRLRADPSTAVMLPHAETDSALRQAMKDVTDLISMLDPDETKRLHAVQDVGLAQDPEKMEAFEDVMRLAGYGLTVGNAADLVVVDGETITHAVVAHPPRRLVVKRGHITARNGHCVRPAP